MIKMMQKTMIVTTHLALAVAMVSCGSSGRNSATAGAGATPGLSNSGGNEDSSADSSTPNDHDISSILWQESAQESQKEITAESYAPRHYGFMLPLRSIPLATYFYGPRVMSSYDKSEPMVEGKTALPVILLHPWQHPLQHLLGPKMSEYSWEFHGGVDLVAKDGTSIFATNDGVIVSAGSHDCVGETVVIRHQIVETEKPVYSVYYHLQPGSYGKFKPGDKIAKGVQFAKSGHTGSKSCIEGPHLHFEMRAPSGVTDISTLALSNYALFLKQTATVNPADYIKEIDDACQKRKNMEIENARLVQKNEPGALAPLTAGRCGIKYESQLSGIPLIYGVTKPDLLREIGIP